MSAEIKERKIKVKLTCYWCEGRGWLDQWHRCEQCNGEGWQKQELELVESQIKGLYLIKL